MPVHAVEDELIRSNARRAFMVGYLLGITWDALSQLKAHAPERSDELRQRLDELYPLIDNEFYSALPKKTYPVNHPKQKDLP